MNVKTLRALIADLPDDADIIVWIREHDEEDSEAVDVHDGHVSSPNQMPALHLQIIV